MDKTTGNNVHSISTQSPQAENMKRNRSVDELTQNRKKQNRKSNTTLDLKSPEASAEESDGEPQVSRILNSTPITQQTPGIRTQPAQGMENTKPKENNKILFCTRDT